MGILHHALSLAWNFISLSAWSPVIIFAAVEGVVLLLRFRVSRVPWTPLAVALCIVTAVSSVVYLITPILHDDVETGVASISAILLRGGPMYPSPDSAQRYIVAYGPLAFAARVPAYWIFGSTIFAFKLTGVLAFFATLAGLYRICRHYAVPAASVLGLGCCCVAFIRFLGVSFWGRGDPFILCLITLSLWAILEAPAWVVLLATGIAFAVLPDLKITAGAYLFPILWLLIIRRGWKIAAAATALGLALFCIPFLSAQISVANYWFALNNSRHVLKADILLRNFQYAAILLLPNLSIVLYRARNGIRLSRDQAVYFALILCSIVAACFVGANFGSGPYHLLPCIVPMAHLYFWLRSELPAGVSVWSSSKLAIACMLSMFFFSTVSAKAFLTALKHAGSGREAISEIRNAEAAHPGQRVEVGIGGDFNDFRTFYGAVTTLDGEPYTIGALAVRELQVAGIEIPDSTVHYIEQCGTQVWLIPKGDAPFTASELYFGPGYPAFSDRFRKAFLDHYKKTNTGIIYDTWSCRV